MSSAVRVSGVEDTSRRSAFLHAVGPARRHTLRRMLASLAMTDAISIEWPYLCAGCPTVHVVRPRRAEAGYHAAAAWVAGAPDISVCRSSASRTSSKTCYTGIISCVPCVAYEVSGRDRRAHRAALGDVPRSGIWPARTPLKDSIIPVHAS